MGKRRRLRRLARFAEELANEVESLSEDLLCRLPWSSAGAQLAKAVDWMDAAIEMLHNGAIRPKKTTKKWKNNDTSTDENPSSASSTISF